MMSVVANIKDLPDYNKLIKHKSSYTAGINKNADFKSLRDSACKKALNTFNLPREVSQAAEFPEIYSFDRYSIDDPELLAKLESEPE